jgi:hypothetical protein
MDTKKKILVVGAAALMVIGFVVAANAAVQGGAGAPWKGWGRQGMDKANLTASLGLPENATREQIGDAMWEKKIKDLGLTDSSTLAEYRQAVKAQMQSNMEQRKQGILAKLGLPADATKEDIQNAMQKWRQDNKELLPGKGGHRGFGMGFGGGCKGQAQSTEPGG